MKIFYLIYAFIFAVALSGCDALIYERGNGEMIMTHHEIDDFSRISLSGNFEVYLKKGASPELDIEIDENLEEYIEIYNRDGVLTISQTERIRSDEGIKLFFTYVTLERLEIGGASSIFTEDPIEVDDLEISMSGAGLMEIEVETENLEIYVSGAGMINVKGRTTYLNLEMSGAGSFEGDDLTTKDAIISISGVGGAVVNVSGELDAKISGIGGIEYLGNPKKVNKQVSGLGKIKQAH